MDHRESDWHLSALTSADYLEAHLLPRFMRLEKPLQVAHRPDGLSVDGNDHIAQLSAATLTGLGRAAQSDAVSGPAGHHFRDDCPTYSQSASDRIR